MKEHDVEHRGVLEAIFLKGGAEVLLGAFAERDRFKKAKVTPKKRHSYESDLNIHHQFKGCQ